MKKPVFIEKFISRHRYAICVFYGSLASLLGFVNPLLSSYITGRLLIAFNMEGVIPALISMLAVKGMRTFLRFRMSVNLQGNSRAPIVWLQHKIGGFLWWLEPMVDNWGLIGHTLRRFWKNGVSSQVAIFITSSLTDTFDVIIAGIVYYFTKSYILSLLSALMLPFTSALPWFAQKTLRLRHFKYKRPVRSSR